jgi:very-short-patch-repair endonuclease
MTDDPVKSFVAWLLEDTARRAEGEFASTLYAAFTEGVESPIERIFCAAVLHNFRCLNDRETVPGWHGHLIYSGGFLWPDGHPDLSRRGVRIFPQAHIGPYRADFLFVAIRGAGQKRLDLVVECDGHDFHERTKDQARHDRSRDRWMTAQGIQVFRFTGSEIMAAPLKVAQEVFLALDAFMQPKGGAQ